LFENPDNPSLTTISNLIQQESKKNGNTRELQRFFLSGDGDGGKKISAGTSAGIGEESSVPMDSLNLSIALFLFYI
jgi:hypothetical protein